VYFWHFSVTTNGRDLNPIDIHDFPINLDALSRGSPQLDELVSSLMHEYQANSRIKEKRSSQTGQVEYQEFYPRLSKSVIDEIDRCLGDYYDLTAAELDYIINYDIKYRMGQCADDDGDD